MNIDSWQKGYAELSRQLANLKKENLAMSDELIKLRRTYEDQINNLTFDNMPTVKKITLQSEDGVVGLTIKLNETNAQVLTLAEIQTEQGKNIAAVDVKADEAKAEVNIATQTATEASNAVASLSAQTDANEASIKSLAEVQTVQGKNIAAIAQTANELGVEVAITAENVSNGAYIVARVNEDESGIKIKADKVEIEGVVTFSDLEEPGKTTINGANLMTGTVVADRIAFNERGQIDFDNLGYLSFSEEGTGANGEIYLKSNEYEQGEILINVGGSVVGGTIDISSGSASMGVHTDTSGHGSASLNVSGATVMLSETADYKTHAIVYADNFVMNGEHGLSGTFSLGNGSITVVNGIVVNVVEGGGGGGGGSDEPDELLAPNVSINEDGLFTVDNTNGAGTLYYYTYWYDDYGGGEEGQTRTTSSTSVSGYADDYPPGGGWVGIYAHVIYNGKTSPGATDEAWFA